MPLRIYVILVGASFLARRGASIFQGWRLGSGGVHIVPEPLDLRRSCCLRHGYGFLDLLAFEGDAYIRLPIYGTHIRDGLHLRCSVSARTNDHQSIDGRGIGSSGIIHDINVVIATCVATSIASTFQPRCATGSESDDEPRCVSKHERHRREVIARLP